MEEKPDLPWYSFRFRVLLIVIVPIALLIACEAFTMHRLHQRMKEIEQKGTAS